ncbi:MAG: hypothetical protein M8352_10890, partial [ANME-2 cluster archaeon]|nr:hypothetical protein [ANME-2 cluster archaeon]
MVESTDGLANSPTQSNVISLRRAQIMNSEMNNSIGYRTLQDEQGLYSGDRLYDVNFSLYNTDNSLYLNDTGGVVLNNGPKLPQSTNVAQTIRVVYV